MEYYEDIAVNKPRRLGPFFLTGPDIREFAVIWDPLPMHTGAGEGQVIASGFHLLAISHKLMIEQNPLAVIIGLGLEEVKFLAPGRPGDSLTVEIAAIAKRESKSRPGVGIVSHSIRMLNQHGETVLTYKGTGMVEKRNKLDITSKR